jgi:hypothetical protein
MGLLVNTIPTIIPVMSFLAYLLLMRQPLSAAQAFTALSLFNILRFPLFQLPQIVTQVRVSAGLLGRCEGAGHLIPPLSKHRYPSSSSSCRRLSLS